LAGFNNKKNMKTKPFNLEKALNGAKVVTRDGREVTQLTCFDTSDNYEYSLYGVIGKDICCWARTGQVNIDTNIIVMIYSLPLSRSVFGLMLTIIMVNYGLVALNMIPLLKRK
jgi:hypothetical protein